MRKFVYFQAEKPISASSRHLQPGSATASSEHCTTCSDEALPVVVLYVDSERSLARVQDGEIHTEVDITLIEDPQPGDTLLVHGGVALTRLEKLEKKA